ncbi:MAG TPA: hypothetical protein VIE68_04350 [Gemmatimonadota bacterium]
MTNRTQGADPRAGGLALLVATEDRLEAMLASRREEAARLIAEARAGADRRLAEMDAEVASRATLREREIDERAVAALRDLVREGERRAARWRDVPASRLDQLAGDVLERLLDTIGDRG